MEEFNKIGKQMPYKLHEVQLNGLKERCLKSATQKRQAPISPWTVSAVAAVACVAVFVVVLTTTKTDDTFDSLDAMIENIDDATLEHWSNNDYDDIVLTTF